MDLLGYLAQQQASFVRAFDDPLSFPIGVKSPAQTARSLQVAARWTWTLPDKCFVRQVDPGMSECWVHVDYPGYRTAFLAFLSAYSGVPSSEVPPALHVDHTVSRGYARRVGIQFVRLALLHQDINTSYGGRPERAFLRLDLAQKGGVPIPMDYLVMLKILGIPVPRSKADLDARAASICQAMRAGGVRTEISLLDKGLRQYFQLWDVV